MELSLKTKCEFVVRFELTRKEAKALDALSGYGFDSFIECFYKGLGRHYMEPYADDLRKLLEKIRTDLMPEISRIEKCERVFMDSIRNNKNKGES